MNEPFLAHSEITNEIYIICGKKKYCVTDQAISAMKVTGRLPEIYNKDVFYKCLICGKTHISKCNFCPNCGAKMRGNKNDSM